MAYKKMSFKDFLFLALVAILFSEANDFSNFGRGSPKKHFCGIILKSVHWSRIKDFLFLALTAIFCSVDRKILASLVEGHPRNISVKLF